MVTKFKPKKAPRFVPRPNKQKSLYPRMITRHEPKIVWSPIFGVITDNGNYVFYRRAVWSRNVFWTARMKPIKKNGLFYMPPVFHKIQGWVYLTKTKELIWIPKPVWGDAKSFKLYRTKQINNKTIEFAISELKNRASHGKNNFV